MATIDLSRCFGCGRENPKGLHLVNSYHGERSHIEFDVGADHCGHPGLMHGGITCVLFDEAMFHAIARTVKEAVTLTMTVDYKGPAMEGHHLICEAWIVGREGRKIDVAAEMVDGGTGDIVAEARGSYLEVDVERMLGRRPNST
jgi:uncharacterized protein (TIGR00369 family)